MSLFDFARDNVLNVFFKTVFRRQVLIKEIAVLPQHDNNKKTCA